ncbi:alcohol dehydrogenase-like regulatory protein ErcA [Desulfosediminicola flagellatus]|uniref:alcohol dehydrogenase-like regulatory protein ErcA n=1 Tax=Desulfosediminicola flagellatus TaxID=2569541 RepID=UPI0010AB8FB6|nr:alcohol dehydrogenase-like regulatory protein ErcA [Desulfosediminicola flagellatus]
MLELRKFVAPEYIFGAGAIDLVGQYAHNFGARKVFIVTDPGVIKAGWLEKVQTRIEAENIRCCIFSDISPNPRAEEVMAGAERYAAENCDVIVSVGGGSPMDCAKGIGIVVNNRKHILTFEGIDMVPIPGPPLICIPTTAGTSADVSQFAIINDTQNRVKKAIISKTTVPDIALIDPATSLTMDPYLTSCTAIDALVHAIEAYTSTANAPMFDLHALEAIRLISSNLEKVLQSPDDLELRSRIMHGSLQAGLAFSNASLGAVHAMAHSLGGYLDLPHGECNAILLNHVMEFNYQQTYERYADIGRALGLDPGKRNKKEVKNSILNEIIRLKNTAGITRTLKERGTSISDIPQLAGKAIHDPCMVTNPRMPVQRDIEVIYEEAL